MIQKIFSSISGWFKTTASWWFTTLFGKIGVLFIFAAFSLSSLTYFFTDWRYTGKDDILDAHDAYLYNELVASWGSPPDVKTLANELENLKLKCTVFKSDNDKYCENDTLIYWSNHPRPVALCNYLSYSSTENYSLSHNIKFDNYVSFGDLEFNDDIVQATFVERSGYKYLITLDIPPTTPPTFVPFVLVAFISLYVLYQLIRRFLKPIALLQKRINDLEKGDLKSKVAVRGNDELAVLTKNFNEMVEEIKDLLKQKERLLSDVSHELRTPLTSILGYTESLMTKSGDDQKLRNKFLRVIEKQTKRMTRLISDQLSLAKIETEEHKIPSKSVNLKLVISEVLDFLSKEIETLNISVVKEVNKNSKNIRGNKEEIFQVILNLVENAIRYSGKGSTITVKLDIAKTKPNGLSINSWPAMCLEIKDNGPGIDKAHIGRLTERFYRVDASRSKEIGGTGLGLAIVKHIINRHRGLLIIESELKVGSKFSIYLKNYKK